MKEIRTVREKLYWSYANLAMAHTALDKEQTKYGPFNFMIRSRLFKGLITGSMNIHTLLDDEKIKLGAGNHCSYCGAGGNLALDHLIPRYSGGQDTGDNLIYACRSCNSSKGKLDLMVWMEKQKKFPPLMVLRRYLKIVITYCTTFDRLDMSLEEVKNQQLPFSIEHIPIDFPKPSELIMFYD